MCTRYKFAGFACIAISSCVHSGCKDEKNNSVAKVRPNGTSKQRNFLTTPTVAGNMEEDRVSGEMQEFQELIRNTDNFEEETYNGVQSETEEAPDNRFDLSDDERIYMPVAAAHYGEELDNDTATNDREAETVEPIENSVSTQVVHDNYNIGERDTIEPIERVTTHIVDLDYDSSVSEESVSSPHSEVQLAVGRVPRNELFVEDYSSDHTVRDTPYYMRYVCDGWTATVAGLLTNWNASRTSSQELWISYGGAQILQRMNEYFKYRYDAWVAVMLLASELALKPTKIGMTQFNIEDPLIQGLCVDMENETFLNQLENSMDLRMRNRSHRFGLRYVHEYVPIAYGQSALTRHPLANVPVICEMKKFEIKRAVLNHRIGRHIAANVNNIHALLYLQYPDTEFDVRVALQQIREFAAKDLLYGIFSVTYQDTRGDVFGAGVIRDWFSRLVRKVFDPNNGFFTLPDGESEDLSYRIRLPVGGTEWDTVEWYRAIGRVFAMSLINGNPIGVEMNFGLYQILMDKTDNWTEKDLLKDDKILHKSWNDIVHAKDVSVFGLSMRSLDQQRSLVDGDIDLTSDNVSEWSKLAIADHMFGKASSYYTALAQGFYELLPRNIFEGLLHPEDLREMLRGKVNISAQDLIAAMAYTGSYSVHSDQIKWLHEILKEGTPEFRLQFVKFITGLEALPFEFGKSDERKLRIGSRFGDDTRLPQAHTCFYSIDIPFYVSKNVMRTKLYQAVASNDINVEG